MQRIIFSAILFCAGFANVSRADDCGVRGNDGAQIVKFDCEPAGTIPPSPLQVHTPTGVRGIILGASGSTEASQFRVRYTDTSVSPSVDTIKAIVKILPMISTCEQLQMIGFHPAFPATQKDYALEADIINCSATDFANPVYANSLWGKGYYEFYQHKGFDGKSVTAADKLDDNLTALSKTELGTKGFKPIGFGYATFNGNNKIITGLFINRPAENWAGLFRVLSGVAEHPGSITNLGVVGGRVTGGYGVGGLVASSSGTISNSYFTGQVVGGNYVGGLAGWLQNGESLCSVTDSYANATVNATAQSAGGLASWSSGCSIARCYASGNVFSYGGGAGGLVGEADDGGVENTGNVSESYASGNVTSVLGGELGGLVAMTYGGIDITDCYATGNVSGKGIFIGGLVGMLGYMGGGGTISTSYASGNVTSTSALGEDSTAGGLVGTCGSVIISNSYATGTVSLATDPFHYVGGLIGAGGVPQGGSAPSYSYFTDNTHGVQTGKGVYQSGGAAAFYLPAHDVYTKGTKTWNFTTVWKKSATGTALPRLKWEQ